MKTSDFDFQLPEELIAQTKRELEETEQREEEQYELLSSDGMLVKRPVLVTDTAVLTGFREKEWEKLL